MLSAGAQRGLNILRKGFLGSGNASVNISRVLASDTTALSPINKGE
jgi:hypothetical protein